jgi:hypothetical protein
MIFKPRKMFSLHGKVTLLVCFPVTRELSVEYAGNILRLQWLHYEQTLWEVTLKDKDLASYLINRLRQQDTYQGELFHTGASSHRWIWFYEEGIPSQVRSLEFNLDLKQRRLSTQFKPEDYGSEAMEVYIQQKLKKREMEYMRILPLTTFVGTWNCAGDSPRESIVTWLKGSSQASVDPDILFIGLQEVCKLTPANMLGDLSRVQEWILFVCNEVREAFPSRFLLVTHKDLVGLLLIVFIKEKHHAGIHSVETSAIKLGFRGYIGNKGAVVARFSLYDSSFCVVNCHFEAHKGKGETENVTYRNENFKKVVRVAKFKVNSELVSLHEHE